MLRKLMLTCLAMSVTLVTCAIGVTAQSIAPDQDYENYDLTKIDRYLDIEVWTGHSDGEYYEGDRIVIHFRANRDAFVALYSIDTRGRVNLLFPTYPGEDNFVHGGVTYSLPGGEDDYDLVVSGPEGFEHVQIIAARERFPIPDWYQGPELVDDWNDRNEFLDWVNANYFVRYGGQRFAYDRAVIYVNEWEEYYFRPYYEPIYPSWTIYGNAYIDYYWGASVYVNGIYWGCTPLYLPRIAVGWHTISVYDHYGYGWEHDFHVSRYNTVVFNKTIIQTSPTVKSKYKEVRLAGYRDPVRHGYPNFESRRQSMATAIARSGATVTKGTRSGSNRTKTTETSFESIPKKFVRGSTKIVKTDRGYETDASTAVFPRKKRSRSGSTDRTSQSRNYDSDSRSSKGKSTPESTRLGRSGSGKSSKSSGSSGSVKRGGSGGKSSGSGTVTRKKSSTSSSRRKTSGKIKSGGSRSSSKAAPTVGKRKSSGKSSKSSGKPPKVEQRKSSGKSDSGSKKVTAKKPKSSSSGNKSVEKKSSSSKQKSSSSKKKSGSSKSKKEGKRGRR